MLFYCNKPLSYRIVENIPGISKGSTRSSSSPKMNGVSKKDEERKTQDEAAKIEKQEKQE